MRKREWDTEGEGCVPVCVYTYELSVALDVEVHELEVRAHGGALRERALAEVAAEGPLAGVGAQMVHEDALAAERLAAGVADVAGGGAAARVHAAHVLRERVGSRERGAALAARVRAHALVLHARVPPQLLLALEPLAASRAFVPYTYYLSIPIAFRFYTWTLIIR